MTDSTGATRRDHREPEGAGPRMALTTADLGLMRPAETTRLPYTAMNCAKFLKEQPASFLTGGPETKKPL